jgi:hypothetical protein
VRRLRHGGMELWDLEPTANPAICADDSAKLQHVCAKRRRNISPQRRCRKTPPQGVLRRRRTTCAPKPAAAKARSA